MSALHLRLNKYQSALRNYESHVEPLLHFALLLCENKSYKAAEEILFNIIESPSFENYERMSCIWILRSEIAEELGELQRAVKLFEQASAKQAQPFQDIMQAFKAFKLRHSQNKHNINHINTPQQSSLPSPIISNEMRCTPLTDDFEHFMFESEKKSRQRHKKFEFRSRQNKKQIAISMSPISGFANKNTHKNTHFTPGLSPIMDVSEMTPFTPMTMNMDNSMNISGLSDISFISNNITKESNKENSRQLQGSVVLMEVIAIKSPSKKIKYGSNKVLSPVRRSKRIHEQKRSNNKQNYQKLLEESNYTFVPNPMLNTSAKK